MHACMHAYMHTCIHAYMHTCIHAYMHTCTHACTQILRWGWPVSSRAEGWVARWPGIYPGWTGPFRLGTCWLGTHKGIPSASPGCWQVFATNWPAPLKARTWRRERGTYLECCQHIYIFIYIYIYETVYVYINIPQLQHMNEGQGPFEGNQSCPFTFLYLQSRHPIAKAPQNMIYIYKISPQDNESHMRIRVFAYLTVRIWDCSILGNTNVMVMGIPTNPLCN